MLWQNEVFWDIKPRRMVTVTRVVEQHSEIISMNWYNTDKDTFPVA